MLGYDTNRCPICNENDIIESESNLICPKCGSVDTIVVLSKLLNLSMSIAKQVYAQDLYSAPVLDGSEVLLAETSCVINAMYEDGHTSKEYPSLFGSLQSQGHIYIVSEPNKVVESPYPNTLTWSNRWLPHWSPMFAERTVYILYTSQESECRAIAMSLRSAGANVFLAPFTSWDHLEDIPPFQTAQRMKEAKAPEEVDDLKDVIAKFHYSMSCGKLIYKTNLNVPIYVVVEAVITWIKSHGGKFLWDADSNTGHLIYEGRDYPLQYNNPLLRSFLKTRGGILGSTGEGKAIIDGLCSMAEEAEHVMPISWLSCDPTDRTISIRQGDSLITVKENSITTTAAQTLSFDLIQGDRKWFSPIKFQHLSEVEKEQGLKLLFTAVADFFAVPPVARELIICWLLAIFLKDMSSIRPGMVITGPASTGKSTMLQLLYWLFYGCNESELPTFPSVAGLWRTGSVEPFLPIDNKNMDGMEEAVRTFLDVAATGGKRIMGVAGGSNLDTKTQKVHSLVMISGLDVPLHQDVRTRYIEVVTDFQWKGEFFPLRDKQFLLSHRDQILSAVLHLLAYDVLPTLDLFVNSDMCRKHRILLDTKERMVDYFLLMLAIGSALQRAGVIASGSLEDRWTDYMRERADKTDNVNAKTIEWWKNFKIALVREVTVYAESSNWNVTVLNNKRVGISGSPEELLNALAWAANVLKRKLPWDSAKSLINAFKMEAKAWQNCGWTLDFTENFENISLLWGDGV